jgi:hypothetical protein
VNLFALGQEGAIGAEAFAAHFFRRYEILPCRCVVSGKRCYERHCAMMDEADPDSVQDDVTKIVESAAMPLPSPAGSPEDQVATELLPAVKLPPISVPPRSQSSPSGWSVQTNVPGVPPQTPPQALEPTRPYRESFRRRKVIEYDAVAARRAVAVGCVVAACTFAVLALVFAFQVPPSPSTLAPVVEATVIVVHAVLALGAGALAFGLLRVAERLSAPSPK